MTEQLQLDFDKIIKTSNISKKKYWFKTKSFKKVYREWLSKQKTGRLEVFRYKSNY